MTEAQLMRRARIEQDVADGLYDIEYWDFVVDKGAGRILLHEDAIYEAIESGDYFDSFCDSLEGATA